MEFAERDISICLGFKPGLGIFIGVSSEGALAFLLSQRLNVMMEHNS